MVERRLGRDPGETGGGGVTGGVVRLGHVPLLDPEVGLGQHRHAQGVGDREPFGVHRGHQAADRLGDALGVELEGAARALDVRRVEQRDGRVDDGIAVGQRGLEDGLGGLDRRVDLREDLVQPRRPRRRQACDGDAGVDLLEQVEVGRAGLAHRIRQGAGLADDRLGGGQGEAGGLLEHRAAQARRGDDDDGLVGGEVLAGEFGLRLGGERGAGDDDEFGTLERARHVGAGVGDGHEALPLPGGGDAAGLGHVGERRGETRGAGKVDGVAVVRPVVGDREAAVA